MTYGKTSVARTGNSVRATGAFSGTPHHKLATVIHMTVAADVVENIARDGLVDLPDLVRVSNLTRETLRAVVDEGLVTTSPVRRGRGRGGAITITKEEAIFLLAVAALAIESRVAFATLLRAMKGSGARLSGDTLTITVPTSGGVAA